MIIFERSRQGEMKIDTKHEYVITPENIPAFIVLHDPGAPDVIPHWHESTELICSIDSHLDVYCGSQKIFLGEKDVVVINSCQIHSVVPHGDYRNKGISITFDENYFRSSCQGIDEVFFEFAGNENKRREIARDMEAMYSLYKNSDTNSFFYFEVNSLLLHITYNLLTYFLVTKTSRIRDLKGKYQDRYRDIMTYIRDHYSEDITLSDIAAYSHLSKDHLSREFKHYVGEGFRDYLTGIRVSKSMGDLINTDLSLLEIAVKHGFNDLRSYNRSFHKYYGMSPAKYRGSSKDTPSPIMV